MKTESLFRAEMQRPDGTRIRVEAWSYRTFVSKIRFFATVENARLLAREPIPENVTCCTRCRDLFAPAHGGHSAVCEECVEETVAGKESA
jgi:hypothetical protein